MLNSGTAGWGDKDTFPIALKATREPYHMIPFGIVTVFVTDTIHGIGMMQADPASTRKNEPMFLHSNIVKWSMRNFVCEDCEDIDGRKSHYHRLDDKSPIRDILRNARRVFSLAQMDDNGIDPEPKLWRALEHAACRSPAWRDHRDGSLCERTRVHMERTFGFRFEPTRMGRLVGSRELCVVEPPTRRSY